MRPGADPETGRPRMLAKGEKCSIHDEVVQPFSLVCFSCVTDNLAKGGWHFEPRRNDEGFIPFAGARA